MNYQIILAVVLFITFIRTDEDIKNRLSCDDSYQKGVDAYHGERWTECIEQFRDAMHLYKLYKSVIADCRMKCHNEPFNPLLPKDIDNIHSFEKILKNTKCLIVCENEKYAAFNLNTTISPDVDQKLRDLEPYEYLHICYYHMNLLQDAASACFTFLFKHPHNEKMKLNFDYYLGLPEVSAEEVTNYEAEDFISLFLHGVQAYWAENWGDTIANMEESLLAYLFAESKCRMFCEGPFDNGWLLDMIPAVANHYTSALKCKQNCPRTLDMFNKTMGAEFLAEHYDYLQMAYFKSDRLLDACRAVGSYLILKPNDEQMLGNKEFYETLGEDLNFSPRPEIVQYSLRDEYEKEILKYINEEFKAEDESKTIVKNEL